jgi:hypothetical protein
MAMLGCVFKVICFEGIFGVDPKTGIPYETQFCAGTSAMGVVALGLFSFFC